MIYVVNLSAINIRELTKKEKFLGLNVSSWIVSVFASLPIINFYTMYSFILFFSLMVTFFVLEFFDEDITGILFSHFSLKTGSNTFYN